MKNPFNKLRNRRRDGVTIVEVLTSIVVAVIGVAGVLVMIPFGVRQASIGLTLDEATSVAENASAEFGIKGFGRVIDYAGNDSLPWIPVNPATGAYADLVNLNTTDSVFLIDPLWLNVHGGAAATTQARLDAMFMPVGVANAGDFQNGHPGYGVAASAPVQPIFTHLMDSANPFLAGTPNPMTQPLATRMFVSSNDLQFGADSSQDGVLLDELSPPQPYFDRVGATNLRRQFRGNISWNAFAVAKRSAGMAGAGDRLEGFDFFVMVHKDRSFEDPSEYDMGLPGLDPDLDPRMAYARLSLSNPNNIFGTGTVFLDFGSGGGSLDIQNDEWIMLVNYDTGGQAQVGFFRVIGSDPETSALTIAGANFEIQGMVPVAGMNSRSPTYAIHLPGVVNVYQRQVNLEVDSNFN